MFDPKYRVALVSAASGVAGVSGHAGRAARPLATAAQTSQSGRVTGQYGMRFDWPSALAGHLTGEAFLSKSTGSRVHPSRSEIARLAYELYERRGREPGNDVDDWLRAESELRRHFA